MDTQKHLYELIDDFDTAMLVTHSSGAGMHARPMAVAQLKPDADTYFVTSIDAPKIAEIGTIRGYSSFFRANPNSRAWRARQPWCAIARLWRSCGRKPGACGFQVARTTPPCA